MYGHRMLNSLGCLVKTIVKASPVQDSHSEQVEKNQIVDPTLIDTLEPFCSLDHIHPESVIKEEVQVHIPPPPIVDDGFVIWFPLLYNPMEGVLGNLSILCQCFHQKEMKRGITL